MRAMKFVKCGIAGAVIWLAACGERETRESTAASDQGQSVHAIGFTEPRGRLSRLSFETSGVIEEVAVDTGDRVNAGDLIARLKDADQVARVRLAEQRVEVAEAERLLLEAGAHPHDVATARARLEAAVTEHRFRELEAARYERLVEGRGVSQRDRDESDYRRNLAASAVERTAAALEKLENQTRKEELALAETRVMEARRALEMEKTLLSQREIRAPVAGTVLERFKEPGESYSNLLPDAVVLFAPEGPLDVRAEVDENFWGRFNAGSGCNPTPRWPP